MTGQGKEPAKETTSTEKSPTWLYPVAVLSGVFLVLLVIGLIIAWKKRKSRIRIQKWKDLGIQKPPPHHHVRRSSGYQTRLIKQQSIEFVIPSPHVYSVYPQVSLYIEYHANMFKIW